MKLKPKLVRNGEVLFEAPLSPADWPTERFERWIRSFRSRLSKIDKGLSRVIPYDSIEDDEKTHGGRGSYNELC